MIMLQASNYDYSLRLTGLELVTRSCSPFAAAALALELVNGDVALGAAAGLVEGGA